MRTLELDLKDSHAPISVVVCDGIAEDRLLRFVKVSNDALDTLIEISDFAHAHLNNGTTEGVTL